MAPKIAIKIDRKFEALIPPLTAPEYAALEKEITTDGGPRDPLIVWHGLLVDGHNRYRICKAHGLPYRTMKLIGPKDRAAVETWMYRNQVGRRNLTEDQIIILACLLGQKPDRGSILIREQAADLVAHKNESEAANGIQRVLKDRWTIRTVYNRWKPPQKRENIRRRRKPLPKLTTKKQSIEWLRAKTFGYRIDFNALSLKSLRELTRFVHACGE